MLVCPQCPTPHYGDFSSCPRCTHVRSHVSQILLSDLSRPFPAACHEMFPALWEALIQFCLWLSVPRQETARTIPLLVQDASRLWRDWEASWERYSTQGQQVDPWVECALIVSSIIRLEARDRQTELADAHGDKIHFYAMVLSGWQTLYEQIVAWWSLLRDVPQGDSTQKAVMQLRAGLRLTLYRHPVWLTGVATGIGADVFRSLASYGLGGWVLYEGQPRNKPASPYRAPFERSTLSGTFETTPRCQLSGVA